jgi:hypothetical protein
MNAQKILCFRLGRRPRANSSEPLPQNGESIQAARGSNSSYIMAPKRGSVRALRSSTKKAAIIKSRKNSVECEIRRVSNRLCSGEDSVARDLLNYIRNKHQADAARLESRKRLRKRGDCLGSRVPNSDRGSVTLRIACG